MRAQYFICWCQLILTRELNRFVWIVPTFSISRSKCFYFQCWLNFASWNYVSRTAWLTTAFMQFYSRNKIIMLLSLWIYLLMLIITLVSILSTPKCIPGVNYPYVFWYCFEAKSRWEHHRYWNVKLPMTVPC